MFALPRVGVLKECRTVEFREAVCVFREVTGDPIKDDADAAFVCPIHEIAEVVRRTVARRRRKITAHLIAPRTLERILGDAHQFDVRVAHVCDVIEQLASEVAPGEKPDTVVSTP